MTPEQLEQWNDYACIPRCLIRLTEMCGRTITRDEFCSRFENLFSDPANRYGLFPTHYIQTVLKQLSLPDNVSESSDYSKVESAFAAKQRILIFSHVDLNHGRTNELHHCSVLTKMDAAGFSIWTPCQDGTDVPLDFNKAAWASKLCSGLILTWSSA